MALVEQAKKGGRYTKREQEQRKIEVYHLHFEENKSAVKIAELLNVSRNTINEDIHYWHKQVASEFQAQDLTAKMRKQIQRMEIQRDRLLDDLEQAESLDEKIRLERFISDIDNRLTLLFSKMISQGITNLEPTANPEEAAKEDERTELEIREFVRNLILEDEKSSPQDLYSEDYLEFEFIKRTKCKVVRAEEMIKKMKADGLSLCEASDDMDAKYMSTENDEFSTIYNLEKFANLRGYLNIDEFAEIVKKRVSILKKIEKEKKQKEEKFIEKYGPKAQWSTKVKEMFDEDLDSE